VILEKFSKPYELLMWHYFGDYFGLVERQDQAQGMRFAPSKIKSTELFKQLIEWKV